MTGMKRKSPSNKKVAGSDHEAQLCTAASDNPRRPHLRGSVPRIVRDPEVRAFIDRALRTMTFSEIVAATRERFGPDRTPSRSAIGRYWIRFCKERFLIREAANEIIKSLGAQAVRKARKMGRKQQ